MGFRGGGGKKRGKRKDGGKRRREEMDRVRDKEAGPVLLLVSGYL